MSKIETKQKVSGGCWRRQSNSEESQDGLLASFGELEGGADEVHQEVDQPPSFASPPLDSLPSDLQFNRNSQYRIEDTGK